MGLDPDHLFHASPSSAGCPLAYPKPASSWEGSAPGAPPSLRAPMALPAGPRAGNSLPSPQPAPSRQFAVGFCSWRLKKRQHPRDGSRERGMARRSRVRGAASRTRGRCVLPRGHLGTGVPYRVALLVPASGAGSGCGPQFWRRWEEVRRNLGAAAVPRGVQVQEVPEQTW